MLRILRQKSGVCGLMSLSWGSLTLKGLGPLPSTHMHSTVQEAVCSEKDYDHCYKQHHQHVSVAVLRISLGFKTFTQESEWM